MSHGVPSPKGASRVGARSATSPNPARPSSPQRAPVSPKQNAAPGSPRQRDPRSPRKAPDMAPASPPKLGGFPYNLPDSAQGSGRSSSSSPKPKPAAPAPKGVSAPGSPKAPAKAKAAASSSSTAAAAAAAENAPAWLEPYLRMPPELPWDDKLDPQVEVVRLSGLVACHQQRLRDLPVRWQKERLTSQEHSQMDFDKVSEERARFQRTKEETERIWKEAMSARSVVEQMQPQLERERKELEEEKLKMLRILHEADHRQNYWAEKTEAMQKSNASLSAKNKRLQEDLKAERSKLDELKKLNTDLESHVEVHKSKATEADAAAASAREAAKISDAAKVAAEAKAAELEKQRADWEADLTAQKKKAAEEATKAASALDAANILEAAKAAAENALSTAEKKVAALKKELEEKEAREKSLLESPKAQASPKPSRLPSPSPLPSPIADPEVTGSSSFNSIREDSEEPRRRLEEALGPEKLDMEGPEALAVSAGSEEYIKQFFDTLWGPYHQQIESFYAHVDKLVEPAAPDVQKARIEADKFRVDVKAWQLSDENLEQAVKLIMKASQVASRCGKDWKGALDRDDEVIESYYFEFVDNVFELAKRLATNFWNETNSHGGKHELAMAMFACAAGICVAKKIRMRERCRQESDKAIGSIRQGVRGEEMCEIKEIQNCEDTIFFLYELHINLQKSLFRTCKQHLNWPALCQCLLMTHLQEKDLSSVLKEKDLSSVLKEIAANLFIYGKYAIRSARKRGSSIDDISGSSKKPRPHSTG